MKNLKYYIIFLSIFFLSLQFLGCKPPITKKIKGGIYKSTDFGETFVKKYIIIKKGKKEKKIKNFLVSKLRFDPLNFNTLYAVLKTGSFIVSYNKGETWQILYPTDVVDFDFHPTNRKILFIAKKNELLATFDGANSFKSLFVLAFGDEFIGIAINKYIPKKIIAITKSGNVYKSENNGVSWKFLNKISEDQFYGFYKSKSNIILAVGNNLGVFRSLNFGEKWENLYNLISVSKPRYKVKNIKFLDENQFYILLNNQLFRTKDKGDSFVKINTISNTIDSFAITKNFPNIIICTSKNVIYKSFDKGLSWKSIQSNISGKFIDILLHPNIDDILFALVEE